MYAQVSRPLPRYLPQAAMKRAESNKQRALNRGQISASRVLASHLHPLYLHLAREGHVLHIEGLLSANCSLLAALCSLL
jgi:hypothetical protein